MRFGQQTKKLLLLKKLNTDDNFVSCDIKCKVKPLVNYMLGNRKLNMTCLSGRVKQVDKFSLLLSANKCLFLRNAEKRFLTRLTLLPGQKMIIRCNYHLLILGRILFSILFCGLLSVIVTVGGVATNHNLPHD